MHSCHPLCSYSYIRLEINCYCLRNIVKTRSKADDPRFSCKTSKLSRTRFCAFAAQPKRSTAEVKTMNQIFPITNRVTGDSNSLQEEALFVPLPSST